jgi:hypothetical protein
MFWLVPPARLYADLLRVLELKDDGRTDREINALTAAAPVNTVRSWRRGRLSETARFAIAGTESCDVCGHPQHSIGQLAPQVYAYLLGVYLCDGCLIPVAAAGASGSRASSTRYARR